MNCTKWFPLRLYCFIFGLLFLSTSMAFASGVELTNLVIKNNREDLLIDLRINGIFTNEMRAALLSGIPVSFTILVILYEVHDFWFDEKVVSRNTLHKIPDTACILKGEASSLGVAELGESPTQPDGGEGCIGMATGYPVTVRGEEAVQPLVVLIF